jgi:hypothetical protein
MKLLRFAVCSCCLLLVACGPKAPIKPDGDFIAINPYPESVGNFAKRPPSDHFELAYQGDLNEALQVVQKMQPQLSIRPPQGKPFPVEVQVDLKHVTLIEALATLREQVGKEVFLDFNPVQKRGRPYVQIRYANK